MTSKDFLIDCIEAEGSPSHLVLVGKKHGVTEDTTPDQIADVAAKMAKRNKVEVRRIVPMEADNV